MDVTTARTELERRRAALVARLQQIETDLDAPVPADWSELAIEREDDEVLEHLGTAGQMELRLIESALVRIASGEYGFCAACGNEIAAGRLQVLPHAPLCRDCAEAAAS